MVTRAGFGSSKVAPRGEPAQRSRTVRSLIVAAGLAMLSGQASCAQAPRTTAPRAEPAHRPQDPVDGGAPGVSEPLELQSEPVPLPTPEGIEQPPAETPGREVPPAGTQTPTDAGTPAEQAWRAAERDRALMLERLLAAMRRLFEATPAEQQGALLVEMLTDQVPEVRSLAIGLVESELADAEPVTPEVGIAVARLLTSPDPKVRAGAARVLNRLAQPGLENDILSALEIESEPSTAAELLAAAARQPTAALVTPMLRWLRQDWPVRESAAQAGLALARADLLPTEAREDAAATLRRVPIDTLSAPAIRLFALVGTSQDRALLRPLLFSSEASRRIAACEALSTDSAFVDDIVAAARSDASLKDIAVRAIATHRASLEGLALLQTLPFTTPESRRNAIVQVTVGMDLSTLIMASDELMSRSPPFVEALLSHVADLQPTTQPEEVVLRARAMLRLAEAMLFQSRPDRALPLIDRVEPQIQSLSDSERVRLERVRTVSLLWLDRLDDPSLADSNPDHWLDALSVLGAEPQGPDVADAFLAKFGASLTPAQTDRYLDIEARVLTGPRPAGAGGRTPNGSGQVDDQRPDRARNEPTSRGREPPPRLPR